MAKYQRVTIDGKVRKITGHHHSPMPEGAALVTHMDRPTTHGGHNIPAQRQPSDKEKRRVLHEAEHASGKKHRHG